MIAPYKVPTGKRLERARQIFDAFADRDALTAGESTASSGTRIAFSRLYAFAANPDPSQDPALSGALKTDARLAADFRQVLEINAIANLPRVAAVDTGPMTTRDGEGCRMWMVPSEAEPDQMYVIFELNDRDAQPKNLVLLDGGLFDLTYPLPPARNGTIQLIVKREDRLVGKLGRPRSEVYLG